MTEDTFPVLYVLARVDLESMNPGKLAAQTCHSGSAFAKHMDDTMPTTNHEGDQRHLYNTWKNETSQGFGTVLVLGVTEAQMNAAVDVAKALDFVAGVVHDPSYPLRDGDTVHFLPIDTAGYVFGDKNDPMLKAVVGNFKLHP